MKKKLWKYLLAQLMVICMAGILLPLIRISAREAGASANPIRVACVGDSLTYGYLSSSQPTKSYPARLRELLGEEYLVQNFGRNSATLLNDTDLSYTNLPEYKNSLAFSPDIVIIMLGSNDSKAKYWDAGGRERFASDAKALVSAYQNLPSRPRVVFATSPACLFSSVNDIRGNIIEEEIVPMQRQLADENGWETIDMFVLTSDKDTLYYSDGVHFSDLGYYFLAECMYDAVTGEAFLSEALPVADIRGLSEQSGNEAKYAADDDYTTIWHSAWEPASPREDHVLILELEERGLAEGLDYLPRQVGTNGIITEYEIQVSNDGGSQYTTAAEGNWAADAAWKKVRFSKPMAATHIKLIVKAALDGAVPCASAAEIRIEGNAYTAASFSEARENLQADYSSYLFYYAEESLYEAESWHIFRQNMQLVQSSLKRGDLTYTEAVSLGKDLRRSVLALQKKEPAALDIHKAMKRKFFMAKDKTILPYRIYLPEGYTAEKKYPLVLYLHGADERGSTNTAQLTNSNEAFFHKMLGSGRRTYPAIIVAPQCPAGEQWVDTPWENGCYSLDTVKKSNEMQAVEELLASLLETYSINKNRLYAVGFSMGAFGVWDLIMRNPDLMAAAIPISGAGDPSQAEQIKDVPVWCFHGADDPVVPCSTSTSVMAEALTEAGSESMRYTEYPAGTFSNGHLIVSGVYEEAEFLPWLFEQKKEMNTAALSHAVFAAEQKDPKQYTADSYQAFLNALLEAKALLTDDSAEQEDIDAALGKLLEAGNGLKIKQTNTVDHIVDHVVNTDPPGTPGILSVSRKAKCITVSWNSVSNASGYEVSYGTAEPYRMISVAGQNVTSYPIRKTNTNAVYRFRIRAYRDVNGQRYYSGYSAWNKKSVDIPKPKSVSVKKSGKAVRIKWKKISGAAGYQLLRRTGTKGKFKVIGTIKNGKKAVFIDKKVKTGKKYYYKVRAIAKSGKNTCTGPLSAAKPLKI